MRWKRFSALIVISLFWPVCGYAQNQPAQQDAPAPQSAAAPGQTTHVRAFGNAPMSQSGPTAATPGGAQPAIDPQLRADILHLFDLMNMESALQRAAEAKLGKLQPTFVRMLPDTPHRKQIAGAAIRRLKTLMTSPAFEDNLAAVYAKYFNDEQVKGLIQIYQSPAWQHFKTVQASLLQSSRQAGEQFTLDSFPVIFAGLCSEYPELRGKAMYCPAASAKAPAPTGPAPSGPAATK